MEEGGYAKEQSQLPDQFKGSRVIRSVGFRQRGARAHRAIASGLIVVANGTLFHGSYTHQAIAAVPSTIRSNPSADFFESFSLNTK